MVSLYLLVSLALAPLQQAPSPYMQAAIYPAGSPKADPEAPGGHGNSDNLPKPIAAGARIPLKVEIVFRKTAKDGLYAISVRNGTLEDKWFNASDGNLQSYLEAKDETGQWRPLEYHNWAWCGNSRHRVLLPSWHFWSMSVVIPSGPLKAQVRLHLKNIEEEMFSNALSLSIPRERFSLAPDIAKTQRLHMGWGVPTIVPLDSPIK